MLPEEVMTQALRIRASRLFGRVVRHAAAAIIAFTLHTMDTNPLMQS